MTTNRFSSYEFTNGLKAKNRVVVPPMASQTADENGFGTKKSINHYARLVQSNAGLIFVEYSFIHQSGKSETNQLGIDSDLKIPALKEMASTIRQSGALAGIQLVHAGSKTTEVLTGETLMAPSPISVPVKGWTPDTPRPMNQEQIQLWINWFLEAAERAIAAGFDIIELHAAHGYGLNQWLSPITNQRDDLYGRTAEGRSFLLIKIAMEIKMRFPKILLSVRIPAQDHINEGLTVTDMTWVVSQLELAGVDLINVSSGIGGWSRPDGRTGQGYLVEDAAQIKSSTQLPVIGVGGIQTGSFIDEILKLGKVDFAAVGRAILENPEGWGKINIPCQSFISR